MQAHCVKPVLGNVFHTGMTVQQNFGHRFNCNTPHRPSVWPNREMVRLCKRQDAPDWPWLILHGGRPSMGQASTGRILCRDHLHCLPRQLIVAKWRRACQQYNLGTQLFDQAGNDHRALWIYLVQASTRHAPSNDRPFSKGALGGESMLKLVISWKEQGAKLMRQIE